MSPVPTAAAGVDGLHTTMSVEAGSGAGTAGSRSCGSGHHPGNVNMAQTATTTHNLSKSPCLFGVPCQLRDPCAGCTVQAWLCCLQWRSSAKCDVFCCAGSAASTQQVLQALSSLSAAQVDQLEAAVKQNALTVAGTPGPLGARGSPLAGSRRGGLAGKGYL